MTLVLQDLHLIWAARYIYWAKIGYCKPECSTGGAHAIFREQKRLESSMILQVSCWCNLQACILLSSKNTGSTKKYLPFPFYFMLIINDLCSCLCLLINSKLLLSNTSWFGNLIINNLYKLCLAFLWTFLTIFHIIIRSLMFPYIFWQFSYIALSFAWLLYLSLNCISDTPK